MKLEKAIRMISQDNGETLMVAYSPSDNGNIEPYQVIGVDICCGVCKNLCIDEEENRTDFWIEVEDFDKEWFVVDFVVLADIMGLSEIEVRTFREDLSYER